jgi:hypothetical protein
MFTRANVDAAVSSIQKETSPLVKNILDIVEKSNSSGREVLRAVDPKVRESNPLVGSIVGMLERSIEQSPATLRAMQSNIDEIASSAARVLSASLGLFASDKR